MRALASTKVTRRTAIDVQMNGSVPDGKRLLCAMIGHRSSDWSFPDQSVTRYGIVASLHGDMSGASRAPQLFPEGE
jgi:hypothetical protein